jgi:glycerol-3-phosphate acyltransferase PlsY
MGPLALAIAYALGGIPFGLIIVKLTTGQDVRAAGSGNIGATNVLRTTGRKAGILTLLLDMAKGWIAVWLAARMTGGSVLWTSLAALAVLIGHAFPVWLGFNGGKAVASFIGAFAYLTPVPLLAVLLIFLIVLSSTRYLSLGSIVAAALFPFACWMILHPDWPVLVAAAGSAVLIVWRHRANLARIRNGNENIFRFGRTVR